MMERYSIYGQKRVQALLVSSIQRNRLAHAYLFYGQPGVGKDAVAVGMALGLNCAGGSFGGCSSCDSCRRMLRFEHPAFRMVFPMPTRPKSMKEEKYQSLRLGTLLQRIENPYVEPSGFSETTTLPIIGIESIAELKRELSLKLFEHRYRIFLISHADRMTVPAANSLLKLLEEPPERAVFFLTTAFPGGLLPTIVSRCQKVRFDPLTETDIAEALADRWRFERNRADFFAGLSGGSLQQALELSAEGFLEKRDAVLVFLEACLSADREVQYAAVENVTATWDKLEILFLLQILIILLRDWFCLQSGYRKKVLNSDRIERLERFIHQWPALDVDEGVRSVQQAIDMIRKNVYLQLVMLELSCQLNGLGTSSGKPINSR